MNEYLYSVNNPINLNCVMEIYTFEYKQEFDDDSYLYRCIENPIFSIVVNSYSRLKYIVYNLDEEQQEIVDKKTDELFEGQAEYKFKYNEENARELYYDQVCEEMYGSLPIHTMNDSKTSAEILFTARYNNVIKNEILNCQKQIAKCDITINQFEKLTKISDMNDVEVGSSVYQMFYNSFTEFKVKEIKYDETGQMYLKAEYDRRKHRISSGTYIVHLVKKSNLEYMITNVTNFENKKDKQLFTDILEYGNVYPSKAVLEQQYAKINYDHAIVTKKALIKTCDVYKAMHKLID